MLVILSGPSGSGKTTICSRLLSDLCGERSISATTRPPRPGEVNGREYWFLKREDFLQKAREGFFAEHAEYCGHLYGTPLDPLAEAVAANRMVFLVIEVDGAKQIRKQFPDTLSLFIKSPSAAEATRRIEERDQDTSKDIAERNARATVELQRAKEYDYVIVNDDLDAAVSEIKKILAEEQAKRSRSPSN